MGKSKADKVDEFLARSRQNQGPKEKGYREQSLKIHPWVCARCAREFTNRNVHELTVHHKDHDHKNNPSIAAIWIIWKVPIPRSATKKMTLLPITRSKN